MILLVRPPATTTWHSVLSFSPGANNFLKNVRKGSRVYVEAAYEVRDPDPAADASTPQGQRQIFLRHGEYELLIVRVPSSSLLLETMRVLQHPPQTAEKLEEEEIEI